MRALKRDDVGERERERERESKKEEEEAQKEDLKREPAKLSLVSYFVLLRTEEKKMR